MWQVIGHERPIRLLHNSIEAGRVSNAYLLSGPRQVGKLTLAREFAKALNCLESDRPCGQCRSCRKIERGIHPDVQVVGLEDGAKSISIDVVREILDRVALRPAEGKVKIYIIEEAERLSEPAANALLKTLEEPPSSVVMVLTTLDSTMLLPTLVSRCQQIDLMPVPVGAVEGAIRERARVDPEQARLVASLAKGRVGWALEATANPATLRRRTELIDRLVALPKANRVDRFAYAAELASLSSRDPEAARSTLESWQSWWRDLLLYRLGMEDLVVNVDLRDALRSQARIYSVDSLGQMVKAIQETISLLAQNVNARLALEVLMLQLPRA